ncbi:transcriptional regulator [Planctomycetota bacterium]
MSNATHTEPTISTSQDIQNLFDAIATLPVEFQAIMKPHAAKVANTHIRRNRLNKLIQEALTQLRLDIKYLEFDLQATRSERDQYKAELEGNCDFE